jgi:homoaconitase/3-isopropylmalate dehydratase large subunit
MPSMTLTEKILARRAGKPSVAAGENMWVNVDVLMTHDVCGPGTIGVFKEQFGPRRPACGTAERVVIIPDHYIFTADTQGSSERPDSARVRQANRESSTTTIRTSSRARGCPTPTRTRRKTKLQGRLPQGSA